MADIYICRTGALKRLREKLGDPVRNLNTIVIGVHAVGNGTVTKPADLNISWTVQDLKRAESEARGFAIRSLMTAACDALDHYLYELGYLPSPVQDDVVTSILRRENQVVSKPQNITTASVEALRQQLLANTNDLVSIKRAISEFSEKHCGKTRRPSIRERHSKLFDLCKNHPIVRARNAAPPDVYYSAIELLIAWRNMLVHDSDEDQLGSDALLVLRQHADFLQAHHSGIDIERTIDTYKQKLAPSLKDASTLTSILLRYVAAADECLLEGCNLSS